MSSHVEVPVMAVRLAIVLRSARARRPDAERATPGTGVAGQGRNPFYDVLGSFDSGFFWQGKLTTYSMAELLCLSRN